MRWVGAAYLGYLGAALLFKTAKGSARVDVRRTSMPDAFWQGVISNLTNPTTIAFMLALLPQFVDRSAGSVRAQLIVLGVSMKATGLIVLGSVALAAGTAGKWISRKRAFIVWQQRLCGVALIGLGLLLVVGQFPEDETLVISFRPGPQSACPRLSASVEPELTSLGHVMLGLGNRRSNGSVQIVKRWRKFAGVQSPPETAMARIS